MPEPGYALRLSADLLRNAGFRRLWGTGVCMGIMRWLELLVASIYVLDRTGSALLVALLATLRLLPLSLFSTVAGALADRFNRRSMLLLGIGVMTAQSLLLSILAATGALEIWHLGIALFLAGTYWAFDIPIRRTLMAEIGGSASVGQAMSLDSITNNATRMAGPMLGGGVMALIGLEGAYLLGMMFYAAAFAMIVGTSTSAASDGARSQSLVATLMEGWRIALADRLLLGTLLITIIFNVSIYPFIAMVPVIGRDVLGLSDLQLGLLVSAEGFGAALGSVFSLLYAHEAVYRRLYVGGTLVCILMFLAFSQTPAASLAAFFLVGAGLGSACFSSMQPSLVFLLSPYGTKARLMGILSFCIGTSPIGLLWVGLMADMFSPSIAMAISLCSGLAALAAVCAVWPQMLGYGSLRSSA